MKKSLIIVLILSLLITLIAVPVCAEDDYQFNTGLETDATEFKVGETFNVKVSIKDITNEKGFIGVNLKIDYDPQYLSVVYTDSSQDVSAEATSGEQADSAINFGTVNLPASWTGNVYKAQNVVLNEDGSQAGTAVVICTADLESEQLLESGFTTDDFYVSIPFKCIAACDNTAIKIDTDGDLSCTQISEADSSYTVYDCLGKGSELVINNIIASDDTDTTTSEDTDTTNRNNNTWIYILIVAAVVIAVGAAFGIILTKKKKIK